MARVDHHVDTRALATCVCAQERAVRDRADVHVLRLMPRESAMARDNLKRLPLAGLCGVARRMRKRRKGDEHARADTNPDIHFTHLGLEIDTRALAASVRTQERAVRGLDRDPVPSLGVRGDGEPLPVSCLWLKKSEMMACVSVRVWMQTCRNTDYVHWSAGPLRSPPPQGARGGTCRARCGC